MITELLTTRQMTTGLPPPPPSVSPLVPPLRRFAGGLHLHTTDLDDIPLDMFYYPPKTLSALPVMPHPPPPNAPSKVPAPPVLPSSGHVSASSSPWVQRTPPPIPIPLPPSVPAQDLTPTRPLHSALEEVLGNHPFRTGDPGNPTEDWEAKNSSGKPANSPNPERSFPPTPKMIKWVRAKQMVQELSWMCLIPVLTSSPQRLCPPTRKSRCFVCSLGTRTMARRENTEGERKLDGIQSH